MKNIYFSEDLIVTPGTSINEALSRLDDAGTGALVYCTRNNKLLGIITDGDVRRAIGKKKNLEASCEELVNTRPIMAVDVIPDHEALKLMIHHEIDHLPLVDSGGYFKGLFLRKHLVSQQTYTTKADTKKLDSLITDPQSSISDAIKQLDEAGTGALALCSTGRKLVGLLSDGDIRRAVLQGISLESPCEIIATHAPYTATQPISVQHAERIMQERDINQLPVIDAEGNLTDLLLRRELAAGGSLDLSAIIMAGGFGTRLMPLTENVPKPMLPVYDRPLLERTIEKLKNAGVTDINLTTHYLPENIHEHFGNGEKFGVSLNYAQEDQPLGTAGGLKLLPKPSQPFVVINGDILTNISFSQMLNFHKQHQAELTVGVRKYDITVPFGVVECDDFRITSLREKPSLPFFINAGIYLLEPSAYDLIPENTFFNMTDLIEALLERNCMVASFPIIEYWLDIGHHEDYLKAQEDCRNGKV